MTEQEELQTMKQAIAIALNNRWMGSWLETTAEELYFEKKVSTEKVDNIPYEMWYLYGGNDNAHTVFYSLNAIVFDKDFAKALFNSNKELTLSVEGYCKDEEGNTDNSIDEAFGIEEWQYHLVQMILAEDPIEYIKQFLNEGKAELK